MHAQIKPWVLGIETSCDESSLSVFDPSCKKFIYEKTLTQIHAHAKFGGVVPDLASRLHLSLLTQIVLDLNQKFPHWPQRIGWVAATTRPGLITSLLVGGVFGKSLAKFLMVPFVPIDHCEAHLYSSVLETEAVPFLSLDEMRNQFPITALIVSGGHTYWIGVDTSFRSRCLGTTLDDAVGECFDKVARMLGLGYPGGPEVERLASIGDPDRFDLPVPMPRGLDFSLSGLKTAVRLALCQYPEMTDQIRSDLCASFHQSIERLFECKIQQCIRQEKPTSVWFSGGVSANHRLRDVVARVCAQNHVNCRIVPRKYAGDNASMIAYLGYLKYKQDPDSCMRQEAGIVPYSIFSGFGLSISKSKR